MLLIGPETLEQVRGQGIVPVCEAIGIGDLSAVELQTTAIRRQFHQFEAYRCLLVAPIDAECPDSPFAPCAQMSSGEHIMAVWGAADQDPVVAHALAVYGQKIEDIGISSEPRADVEGRPEGGGDTVRHVVPAGRRGERWDRFNAAGPAAGRTIMAHSHIAGFRCHCGVGLGRGHLKICLVVAGMAEAIDYIADFHA